MRGQKSSPIFQEKVYGICMLNTTCSVNYTCEMALATYFNAVIQQISEWNRIFNKTKGIHLKSAF